MSFEDKLFNTANDYSYQAMINYLEVLKRLGKSVIIKVFRATRTTKQNAAIHLYFHKLAEELNNNGCTYQSKRGVQLMFDDYKIKCDWLDIQKEMFGLSSTTQLNTDQINKAYDCINLEYSSEYGVHVDFPSLQGLLNEFDKNNLYGK